MKKRSVILVVLLLGMALSPMLLPGCAHDATEPPIPVQDATPAPTPAPAPAQPAGTGDAQLRCWLINTGESDALLLQTQSGAFLVDTGLKGRFDAVEAVLSQTGITHLDAVIITHGHKDHIGGLKKLLEICTAGSIYTAAVDDETYSDKEMETILDSGAQQVQLKKGDSFSLCGIAFDVLSPQRKYVQDLGEDDNNNSLVLRLTAGEFTLLLMGDATAEIEQLLLDEGAALAADVLKVGRHGKEDASLPEFLAAVSPRVALVTGSHSEEDSSPSEAVLARLAEVGADAYSNDTGLLAVEIILSSTGEITAVEHAWP